MKRESIERLLPQIFLRTLAPNNPLSGILEVMAALHEPSEEILAHIEKIFNPYLSDDSFIPFLAGWVDLDRLFPLQLAGSQDLGSTPPISTGQGYLRELIASAALLSKWRGTATGLKLFLETATGEKGFDLKENSSADGVQKPFHLCVMVPERLTVHLALIERIVEQEKPAYATFEICFVDYV